MPYRVLALIIVGLETQSCLSIVPIPLLDKKLYILSNNIKRYKENIVLLLINSLSDSQVIFRPQPRLIFLTLQLSVSSVRSNTLGSLLRVLDSGAMKTYNGPYIISSSTSAPE